MSQPDPDNLKIEDGISRGSFNLDQKKVQPLCSHGAVKHPEPPPAIRRPHQSSGATVACAAEVKIHFGCGQIPTVLDGNRIIDKGGIYVPAVFYSVAFNQAILLRFKATE